MGGRREAWKERRTEKSLLTLERWLALGKGPFGGPGSVQEPLERLRSLVDKRLIVCQQGRGNKERKE